jgi:hypothetical protein
VRLAAALPLALLWTSGWAATAYVTDDLVLGVYASQTTEGPRLATLHSGATLETLVVNGDSTQVRLPDGTTGWVKSAYLTINAPASARVKELQEELARSRAAVPAPAQAAPAAGNAPHTGAGSVRSAWRWVLAVLIAVAAGFWLGYTTLARRIKYKFGGIKVY